MECDPAESDDESVPEGISHLENWLNWSCDLDNPNRSEDDCEADDRSDVELLNCFEHPEYLEQSNVCAAPNVPGLIRPTRRSQRQTEKRLVTVNATDTSSIMGHRKSRTE